ncbi:unnamed protein product [Mycena citricolor]|uniref:Beta-lactamase-related domain-containing protein n=1 Tax=Mycena citricolor TaxID=2018698 RepID=A0AAD2H0X7_9AGAR|nr:unnamed protein product [Mycena citricolor]
MFAIASNSKLFLSLSVGLLMKNETLAEERGSKFGWDTKIRTLIPEWKLLDEEMERMITIQDMLSHRTGLPRHDYSGQAREGGVAEMISTLRYLKPSAEWREQYQYNNLMYETLSHLPSTFLNQTYESYIHEHLFAPLGMNSSTYSVAEAENWGTLADGYYWSMQDWSRGINGTLTPTIPYFQRPGEEGIWAGAGGVLTSARDLTSWVAMLLNDGRHPITNETVVPADVVEHVATGVTVANGKASYPELSPKVYGCGQERASYRGHEYIEHGGSNPGFKTQVIRFPQDGFGVISLSNDELGNGLMETVKWRLIDSVLGMEPIDWTARYRESHNKRYKESQDVTPRPSSPKPPSSSFAAMHGTFSHGAYGSFSPCYVASGPTGFTPECIAVIASPVVQRILDASPGAVTGDIPTFIVPFKRTFSTYLRLMHFDGNVFNTSLIVTNRETRRAEGYLDEENDIYAGFDDQNEVEWVDGPEPGWAFRGGFWGSQGKIRPLEGSVKDRAEVWFGRV